MKYGGKMTTNTGINWFVFSNNLGLRKVWIFLYYRHKEEVNMAKVLINIITFIPRIIIGLIAGLIGILLTIGLMLFIEVKIGIKKVFDFLTCND